MGKGSKFRIEEKGVFFKLSPSEKFYEYFGDAAKTGKWYGFTKDRVVDFF